jgi:hypothetical protein
MEEEKIELKGVAGFQENDWAIIKKYTYRERTKLSGKSVFLNEKNLPQVDVGKLQFYAVVYGLKDASFLNGKTSTEDQIEFLNNSTQNFHIIFNKISKLNNLNEMQVMLKK